MGVGRTILIILDVLRGEMGRCEQQSWPALSVDLWLIRVCSLLHLISLVRQPCHPVSLPSLPGSPHIPVLLTSPSPYYPHHGRLAVSPRAYARVLCVRPSYPLPLHVPVLIILASFLAVFVKFMHALAGLYLSVSSSLILSLLRRVLTSPRSWEWVTSLDFEWAFLTGKKRFHYPAVSPPFTFFLLVYSHII